MKKMIYSVAICILALSSAVRVYAQDSNVTSAVSYDTTCDDKEIFITKTKMVKTENIIQSFRLPCKMKRVRYSDVFKAVNDSNFKFETHVYILDKYLVMNDYVKFHSFQNERWSNSPKVLKERSYLVYWSILFFLIGSMTASISCVEMDYSRKFKFYNNANHIVLFFMVLLLFLYLLDMEISSSPLNCNVEYSATWNSFLYLCVFVVILGMAVSSITYYFYSKKRNKDSDLGSGNYLHMGI